MSEEINTKLYSFNELKEFSYGKLLLFNSDLVGVIDELEFMKIDIESILNDELTDKDIADLAFIDGQLRYLYKNYYTSIDALVYQESKVFLKDLAPNQICLN